MALRKTEVQKRRAVGRVIILTGRRRVGKTTVCLEAVALAQRRGYTCGGVITTAEDGVRHVVDVASGRRQRLTAAPDVVSAVTQGRFRFNPQALSWGERLISTATPCDLLVIDEIGPLEMARREGWVGALDVLEEGRYTLALLVVRPALVAHVSERLKERDVTVVVVTRDNRDGLPVSLTEMLGRAS